MIKAITQFRQFRVQLIVLLCALFSLPLSAQKAYVAQSSDKTTLTFYYDDNKDSHSGKTWAIDEKKDDIPSIPAWAGTSTIPNKEVTKVVFDASFKNFRPLTTHAWFFYCEALTTFEDLKNLNTSAVTDMGGMFTSCSSLKELNLSNFNTSAVTDMENMFNCCSRLASLDLSNFNTSAVTDMWGMFYGCSSLKELDLSNFNTSAVTKMYNMFNNCSGLKALNLSKFNTSAVTRMDYMFSGCSGLKELDLSNFNTSAVNTMSNMFSGCSGLKELDLSNFNPSAVKYMTEMFGDCSGLTLLNLSNFNPSAVKGMREMFKGCSSLKTILSANTWQCENSKNMFDGCTQLKGAVEYDASKLDVTMANPTTGYFSQKSPSAIGRVLYGENNVTQIYTLQGKRVIGKQYLPAGFYIVNGKKVYLDVKP